MKVSLTNTGACRKEITVEVAAEAVAAARAQAVRDLAREARIPGFRVGRAPENLVLRRYGDQARQATIRRVIGEYLPKALEQSKLDVLGDPEVTAVSLEDGRPMAFTARCDIMPDIPLRPLRGLRVTRPPAAVTDQQAQEVLARLQERHATLEPVSGQTEKIKRVPPLDDAFAKLVGVETLDALRARVRDDLTRELTAQAQRAVEEQAIQQLLDRTPFDVPPSLVQSQGERLLRQAQWRLLVQGVAPEEVEQRKALLTDQAAQGALRQVKTFFLLRQLAATHGLMADEAAVAARIAALAAQSGRAPETVRAELHRERLLNELAWDITRANVLNWVLAQAEIIEKETAA